MRFARVCNPTLVLCLAACSGGGSAGAAHAPVDEGRATDAFVWGYPLVVTKRTLQTFGGLVGVDQLYNQTAPSNASSRIVPSPNDDTLYSVAVLDLRSEPMVLTVPDATDRYWSFQFLDAWTDSFAYIGTRATGGKGGTFVITPPGWSGAIPGGAQAIASPTPQGFLLGRYLFHDTADIANVVALARTLTPLHVVTGGAAPAPPPPLGMTCSFRAARLRTRRPDATSCSPLVPSRVHAGNFRSAARVRWPWSEAATGSGR